MASVGASRVVVFASEENRVQFLLGVESLLKEKGVLSIVSDVKGLWEKYKRESQTVYHSTHITNFILKELPHVKSIKHSKALYVYLEKFNFLFAYLNKHKEEKKKSA